MQTNTVSDAMLSANSAYYGGGSSVEFALKLAGIKEELYGLGLTAVEADVYILLSRSGPKKASEISRILNVPKTKTYVTLNDLLGKGIVKEISGRPAKFEALLFEEVFRVLIHRKEVELTSFEGSLSSLLDLWHSLPPRATGVTSSQQFQKLKGLHQVYYKVREMAQRALKELVVMASEREFARLKEYGIVEDINTVVSNNVDVTVLTEPGSDRLGVDNGLNVVECPSIEGPLPFMILLDRKELLAMTSEDPDFESTALWTNCSTLCEAIHLFFAYEYSH